jgi:hypothetical protein
VRGGGAGISLKRKAKSITDSKIKSNIRAIAGLAIEYPEADTYINSNRPTFLDFIYGENGLLERIDSLSDSNKSMKATTREMIFESGVVMEFYTDTLLKINISNSPSNTLANYLYKETDEEKAMLKIYEAFTALEKRNYEQIMSTLD